MALKSTLLLLALVLTLTKMVSAKKLPPKLNVNVIAPVHAPMKAPMHPPMKAPMHPPMKAPTHAPMIAPIHAPTISPAKPPIMSTDCRVLCKTYCQQIKPLGPFTPCMRSCKPCCDRLHCVPKTMTCRKWNRITVVIHGRQTKCPSRSTVF